MKMVIIVLTYEGENFQVLVPESLVQKFKDDGIECVTVEIEAVDPRNPPVTLDHLTFGLSASSKLDRKALN